MPSAEQRLARLARLEALYHPPAFVMGFIVVEEGQLVGLSPIQPEQNVEPITAWAREPRAGFVFLMTVEPDTAHGCPRIAPAEIHPDALREIEAHLEVGGALYRVR